jgi:hypothetical protein
MRGDARANWMYIAWKLGHGQMIVPVLFYKHKNVLGLLYELAHHLYRNFGEHRASIIEWGRSKSIMKKARYYA